MTYSDAIKSGFRLINRNWQLVFVQLGMMIASCIGFFIFVGIPLAVAFVMFGLDFTEITKFKDLLGIVRDPSEIISRYFGIILVLVGSFILYLLVITSVGLYVFGGSAGLVGRFVKDTTLKFSLKTFFSEGKRLFFPLVGFTSVIGLIFIGVAFILGLFGGGIAAVISISKEHEATLALFLGIFLSLLLLCIGLVLIMCTIALTLYGVAALIFKGTGPIKSTRETIKYLYHNPGALWLYFIAFAGYILASFMLLLLGTPFSLIPIVGTIIAIPFQLFSYTVQSYLGLVIMAATFIYYYSTAVKPYETTGTEGGPTAEGSSEASDTSLSQASEPLPPLPEKEQRE